MFYAYIKMQKPFQGFIGRNHDGTGAKKQNQRQHFV